MKKNLILRIRASTGGALTATFAYITVLVILSAIGIRFYELQIPFNYLIAPASLFIGIEPGETFIMDIPRNIVIISIAIYAAIGYLIDWFYEPYK